MRQDSCYNNKKWGGKIENNWTIRRNELGKYGDLLYADQPVNESKIKAVCIQQKIKLASVDFEEIEK